MATKTKSETITLDCSGAFIDIVDWIKEKSEADDRAEVFKNAIKIYAGLIEEHEKGTKFLTRDKNGQISIYPMFK